VPLRDVTPPPPPAPLLSLMRDVVSADGKAYLPVSQIVEGKNRRNFAWRIDKNYIGST
jgi:hypothetical protein